MVNLKKAVLLFIVICFSSCQDYYGAIEGGGLRSKHKNKWYVGSRINPEGIGIDTDVIYTRSHYYKNGVLYNNESKGYILYSHYYKNGNSYRFSIDTSSTLNKNSFDPKKGDIGFVIKRGKKYIEMSYTFFDGGQFRKSEIRMKGDTLVSFYKYGRDEYLNYYKKVEVPKEWLNFEPDF